MVYERSTRLTPDEVDHYVNKVIQARRLLEEAKEQLSFTTRLLAGSRLSGSRLLLRETQFKRQKAYQFYLWLYMTSMNELCRSDQVEPPHAPDCHGKHLVTSCSCWCHQIADQPTDKIIAQIRAIYSKK